VIEYLSVYFVRKNAIQGPRVRQQKEQYAEREQPKTRGRTREDPTKRNEQPEAFESEVLCRSAAKSSVGKAVSEYTEVPQTEVARAFKSTQSVPQMEEPGALFPLPWNGPGGFQRYAAVPSGEGCHCEVLRQRS